MPRWGVKNACDSWATVALAAGLFYATAFGATTILDPAQVAREFTQRSWQKKDGLPDNQVQALQQTRDAMAEAIVGVTRARMALERAGKENIKLGLTKLSELDLR